MKFKFPHNATVPDPTYNAANGARVKVRDAILQAAGNGVNCQETKRGQKCTIEVHIKPGSQDEARFALALPSGVKPDFEL